MKFSKENILFERKEDVLTVSLLGDIDHHSAREYHKQIDAVLFIERPNVMLLDLSSVTFMDSSGLGLILGRYRITRELGIVFKIVSPSASVMKIIRLSGCEKYIEIIRKKDA